MTRGTSIAAAFLAIGFGFISLVLLVIEPRMGFATLADYFDPSKVFAAAASPAWILGDIVYIGFGVALAYLAVTSADAPLGAAGLVAAVRRPRSLAFSRFAWRCSEQASSHLGSSPGGRLSRKLVAVLAQCCGAASGYLG
jgi:hypothetical protein